MKRIISFVIGLILLIGLVWSVAAGRDTAVSQNAHTSTTITSATGSITGTVTDGINPLPNILVQVLVRPIPGLEVTPIPPTYTDSNGYYEVTALEDHSYLVHFSDESHTYVAEYYDDIHTLDWYSAPELQISGGNTLANIDAVLTLSGHISGRVTDAITGNPISGIPVGTTVTDSNGYYTLHNILPGTHTIKFGIDYGPRIYIPQDSAPFEVALGETVTNIDASMVEGGHITGRVTAEDNITPLENITVRLGENYGYGWLPGYAVTTDGNGEYQFNGLLAMNYRIYFSDDAGLYVAEAYDDGNIIDIPVVLGETTANINASLAKIQLPPIAVQDTATTTLNTPITIDVLANDSDPNNDPLTISTVGNPSHGTASIFGNKVIYAPYSSYVGTDSFTYGISDGQGGNASALVTITIEDEQQFDVDPTQGGEVPITTADYDLTIDIPANALPSQTNKLVYRGLGTPSSPPPGTPANIQFTLTLLDAVDQEILNPTFDTPLSITIQYNPAVLPANMNETDIQVYYFNTATQTWESIPVLSRNPGNNKLVIELTHFTEFALLGPYLDTWSQVNTNGFGNPNITNIFALEVWNDTLFAGTGNWTDGATVWRYDANTSNWTQVSQPGFSPTYTNTNAAILDMTVFNNQLYASTGWSGAPGQLWRSSNGSNWSPITTDGFGDGENEALAAFGHFNGYIYLGTHNGTDGAEIWRSNTGNAGEWTQVFVDGGDNTNNHIVTSFREFKGNFYVAIENDDEGLVVWRTNNGTSWTQVNSNGFGDADNIYTGGFQEFDGYLYIGTRNNTTGAQLWRSSNGTTWTQVIDDGFGDLNNIKIDAAVIFDGDLHVVTENQETGMEVWRSEDGLDFVQVNQDGFGNRNLATLWNSGTAVYQNKLYVGTINNEYGGGIWMTPPTYNVFLPMIVK